MSGGSQKISNDKRYISIMNALEMMVNEYKEYKKKGDEELLETLHMVKNVKKTIEYMKFLDKIIKGQIIVSQNILKLEKVYDYINEYNDLREEVKKYMTMNEDI